MKSTDFVLETTHLTRDYGGKVVLEDVSLSLEAGQILALLGPNGVGKTTLLKLIAGLLTPSAGEARVWGQSCWPPGSHQCRVACVFEGFLPPSDARVDQIFALKRSASGRFDDRLARTLCEKQGVGLRSRWGSLSKGQRRLVLLAAALGSDAELMLLDEPADGLDVAIRRELYGLLRERANDRGTAVVVASHIIADLERIADDVAILKGHRLGLSAPLEQLRDEVFELVLAPGASFEELEPVAAVISSKAMDDGLLAVVRFRSPHLAESPLPNVNHRRRLGLEEIYLAYTQPATPVPPPSAVLA